MAFIKRFTLGVGNKVKASELNSNFDDIASFLNNSVAYLDGTKAFTGLPNVALDPANPNDLVRKSYVDGKDSTLTTSVNQRLKQINVGNVAVGTAPTVSSTLFKVLAGVASVPAGNGQFSVTFPTTDSVNGFAGGVVSIVATVTGASTYEAGTANAWVRIGSQSKTGFSGIVLQPGSYLGATGAVAFTAACSVNWIAIGW